MKIHKLLLMLFFACFSPLSHATEVTWLSGIYVDTLNKVNARAGFKFYNPRQLVARKAHGSGFKYVDMEIGAEGTKFGLGLGVNLAEGQSRYGLSYADINGKKLVGVESIISVLGAAIKLGLYSGLSGAQNRYMIGVGIGM